MRVMLAGFLMFCAAIHSVGLSLKLAPVLVVLQRADPASGDGGVQVHVGALEPIGGVVEASQGQWSAALEVRNPGPEQQGNRIGPRPFALARFAELRREPRTGSRRERRFPAAIASALRARR